MNIQLYILPNRIGLKFAGSTERDAFWNRMSDGARTAAERIANRTIRLYPDRMKDPNGLIIPLSGNGTVPVAIVPKPAPPAPAKPPASNIVNVGSVADPFAVTGNATKALPGMVPIASNIPQGNRQEAPRSDSGGITTPPTPENVPQGQGNAGTEASGGSESPSEPAKVAVQAKSDDPEPPDRRTKKWRDWKLRQIAASEKANT